MDTDSTTTTDITKKHTARAMRTTIAFIVKLVFEKEQEKSHAEHAHCEFIVA